jgi:hypothetical protein
MSPTTKTKHPIISKPLLRWQHMSPATQKLFLDAYPEVDIKTWEVQLFRWNANKQEWDIFHIFDISEWRAV